MDASAYFQAILALIFVIGLIGLTSFALRKLSEKQFGTIGNKEKRLGVIEMKAIDHKHRLVLIKRDEVEHLVMIGATGELLIETIPVKKEKNK